MTSENIIRHISSLKKQSKRVYSNSHIIFSKYPNVEWKVRESEKSLVVIISEHVIKRLIFYTADFSDLKSCIKPLKGAMVIEVVSKGNNDMKEYIENMGFEKYMTQARISCEDISAVFKSESSVIQYFDSTIGCMAKEIDCNQINELLWDVFDTKSSHLKSDEELLEQIRRKEFYIHKNHENQIDMLIQCIISPKSFYFNQVINNGEKKYFHAMILNVLKKYVNQGGRYVYAWVNVGNIASFKMFEKYTLVRDGVYNEIYFKS